MSYFEDLISHEWIKYLREQMPDECIDAVDNQENTRVGKSDKIGWFVYKDGKIVWSEKPCKEDNEKDLIKPDESNIDYSYICPDCGGECFHIDPFKQCKNCKSIFDIDSDEIVELIGGNDK